MPSRKTIFILLSFFTVWAFVARLFPHPANATPVGALALFAGVYLPRRWAYLLPLGVLLVSDAWLGGYELSVMFSVYGSFVLVTLTARTIRRLGRTTLILAGPIVSSSLFFLVTNFAVWAATPWYTKDFVGLITSYTLALPFWRNMLVGDIVYVGLFFGITAIVVRMQKRRFLNQELGIRNYGFSKISQPTP